tara:strand:- start:603 stop:1235 length:633 start_codon:yes stop_codon:yes gene_type:complete
MKKSNNEKVINPKVSIYLYSKEKPQGEIFKFVGGREADEYKEMLEDGWVVTPAKLNLPKNNDVGITVEQAENADPSHLKIMLEKIGFIVMTPEQMKAEINKLVDVHIDIKDFTDEALIAEAERRGLKEGGTTGTDQVQEEYFDGSEEFINTTAIDQDEDLLAKFKADAKSLNKEEHIILGKTLGLSLRINFGEDTMINKINEKLEELNAE